MTIMVYLERRNCIPSRRGEFGLFDATNARCFYSIISSNAKKNFPVSIRSSRKTTKKMKMRGITSPHYENALEKKLRRKRRKKMAMIRRAIEVLIPQQRHRTLWHHPRANPSPSPVRRHRVVVLLFLLLLLLLLP